MDYNIILSIYRQEVINILVEFDKKVDYYENLYNNKELTYEQLNDNLKNLIIQKDLDIKKSSDKKDNKLK